MIDGFVNLASKLEKHCKNEGATAVLPAATLRFAAAQGWGQALPWQLRPGREVAGVVAPIDLAVLPAAPA